MEAGSAPDGSWQREATEIRELGMWNGKYETEGGSSRRNWGKGELANGKLKLRKWTTDRAPVDD